MIVRFLLRGCVFRRGLWMCELLDHKRDRSDQPGDRDDRKNGRQAEFATRQFRHKEGASDAAKAADA